MIHITRTLGTSPAPVAFRGVSAHMTAGSFCAFTTAGI